MSRKAADVLRTLKGAWIRAILLTHNAFDVAQRIVFMLLQPGDDVHLDSLDMLDPMTHQSAAKHRHVGAGHNHLDYVVGLINAAGGGEVGTDFSEKDSDPV